jgi:hypothetical protein
MNNKAMAKKLATGRCLDISECERIGDDYILETYVDNVDYCNAKKEQWIWSIARNVKTDQIVASHTAKFHDKPGWECLWLR